MPVLQIISPLPGCLTDMYKSLVTLWVSMTVIQVSVQEHKPGPEECGGNLSATSSVQTIQSPNYPDNYDNNGECIWRISPEPSSKLKLTVTDFLLEASSEGTCPADYLEVEGKKYCARMQVPQLTSNSSVVLKFFSDSSKTNRGFKAEFKTDPCEQIRTVDKNVRTLHSPLYPKNYGDNVHCMYNISAVGGVTNSLVIKDFVVEESPEGDCRFDYLEVDGKRYCGGVKIPPFRFNSNIHVVFHSDDSKSYRGFNASVFPDPEVCGGNMTATSSIQTIQSPNYPNDYDNNRECTWRISPEPNTNFSLTVTDFLLETSPEGNCTADYLEIDGEKYCNNMQVPQLTANSSVILKFYSDGSKATRGFKAELKTDPCWPIETIANNVRNLYSPFYPRAYGDNLHCVYNISAVGGVSNIFGVTDLLVEKSPEGNCTFDYLEVDGKRYCGDVKIPPFSFNSSIRVVFHSDDSKGYRGFKALLSAGIPRSCQEHRYFNQTSGVYKIDLDDGEGPFPVYCDMQTGGYGWVVIQRRMDGSVNFYRNWTEYQNGFGILSREFYFGNENINRLTKAGLRHLRVDLGDWDDETAYAEYSKFTVGDAASKYRLTVGGYNGTAGDALRYNNGQMFTTFDGENDIYDEDNCAVFHQGAWWYTHCTWANLNGPYRSQTSPNTTFWHKWNGFVGLKFTEMKLR